ncbi:THAP domain-containing protein [Phthorimaea operculella]|nr:THAP domain-containing protein [Phthorimaea operculella]
MVYHCIIANCKNEGTHLIPKEESLRQKWIAAVSNHLKARSTIKHCSRICGAHFRYSDYFNHPLTVLRRLKRTAIPSLFPGNNEYIKELPLPVSSTLGLTEINTTSTALFGKREQYEEFVLPTTPPPEVTLPQLVADSETINAPKLEQTSPKDKKEFHFNAGNCYKSYSRAPAIKRVEILPYYDIPLIEIPIKQVNNIFITWVRYMALKWKTLEEDLWIAKESVTAYMASDIHCKFPMSRVILDATGLDIKDIKESETLKVVWLTDSNLQWLVWKLLNRLRTPPWYAGWSLQGESELVGLQRLRTVHAVLSHKACHIS